MRVRLAPSSVVAGDPRQHLTTFRVNREVAIDAGSLGLDGDPESQADVRHVFLSHSHMDHIASLPLFLDNVYEMTTGVHVHAGRETLDSLFRDVFNGRVWPDVRSMRRQGAALVTFHELVARTPIRVAGLSITAIPVDHAVPTFGFIVEDDAVAVAFSSDTRETEELWRVANGRRNLRAVFLEVSFPNAWGDLASAAGHLTPARFAAELSKLRRPAAIYAVHLKAALRRRLEEELASLALPNVSICEPGKIYSFD